MICGVQSSAATSSPFVMLGDFTNVLGDRTSTAASATGASITDSGLTGTLTVATTLTDNPLSSSATTVNVASTTGFPASGFIQIDSEIIAYSAVTATSFTGCQRGAGAGATTHAVAAAVTMESPYRGHFLSIVVAGVVTQRREIISNTAGGQFNVNAKFSPIPSAGAIFRIEAPAVQINMPTGVTVAFPKSGIWGMKGIFWNCGNGNGLEMAEQSACVAAEGIWFRSNTLAARANNLSARGAVLRATGSPTAWTHDGANNPFSSSRVQAGITCRYMLLSAQAGARVEGSAYFVLDSCNLSATEGAGVALTAPHGRFSTISIARCGAVNSITNDTSATPITTVMDVGDGTNQMLQFSAVSAIRNVTGALQLNNSNVSAIIVQTNAFLQNLGTASASINITGTGNLRYGVEVVQGGNFQLLNQGITLTGTLGDLKVGQKPVMTWPQFRLRYPLASAPNNVAADYVPAAPFKKTFTGLVAADFHDLTSSALGYSSPALTVGTLRVTGGDAVAIGSYAVTDVAGTMLSPAAGTAIGLARLSDDGHTVTFPTGSLVTDFIIEYVPCDPVGCSGAIALNNSV
jgi:hypothetical protein